MQQGGQHRRHMWAAPFEIVMAGGVVVTLVLGDFKHFLASIFTLVVSFAPLLAERWWKVRIPSFFHFLFVGFVFSSMFAGEVLGMYARFWPWDDIMHVTYGLLSGLFLATMFSYLGAKKKALVPTWLAFLCIIAITSLFSVLWEVAEFASDSWFHTYSQGADLVDTMFDLIDGVTGVTVMALLWLWQQKGKKTPLLHKAISRFIILNNS